MFFLSQKKDGTTAIDNRFFEQVLPVLDAKYVKVYLYGFYLAQNAESLGVKSLSDMANELSVSIDDIHGAFDYLQACGLIVKHQVEKSTLDNYNVEFLPMTKSENAVYVKSEEIQTQNLKLKNMYEKIEEITNNYLTAYNIKKIDTFIKNNDVSYDVIVEVFKFNKETKKTSSVTEAMKTLRKWVKEGILTTNDLDTNLSDIDDDYSKRRKIFKYWGEVFRQPSVPEKNMMDTWLYTYNFSLDVIYSAIDETTKTKSPSFRYLNSILTKWNEIYEKYGKKIPANEMSKEEFADSIKTLFKLKSFTDEDKKIIRFFYNSYPLYTVTSAASYVKGKVTLGSVFTFLTGQKEYEDSYTGERTLEEVQEAIKTYEKTQQVSNPKTASKSNSSKSSSSRTAKKRLEYNESDISDEELEALLFSKNKLNDDK